jgi:hypothetical protein
LTSVDGVDEPKGIMMTTMRIRHRLQMTVLVSVVAASLGVGGLSAAATPAGDPPDDEQVLVLQQVSNAGLGCEEFPEDYANVDCGGEDPAPPANPQRPATPQPPVTTPQPPVTTPQPPVTPQPPATAGSWCFVNGQWINVPPGSTICIIQVPGGPQTPPTGGPGLPPGGNPTPPTGGPGWEVKPEFKPTIQPTWQIPLPNSICWFKGPRGIWIPYPCYK